MPISCLLVDDHTLFREGIRHLLGIDPEIYVVSEANDAAEALEKVREHRPDVVLMDIGMPGLSSFEAARCIERDYPGTRIIFLTMYEDEEYLLQSLDAGASGYILKDVPGPELLEAVREVSRGRKYLSPRVLEKVLNPDKEQGPRTTRLRLAHSPRTRNCEDAGRRQVGTRNRGILVAEREDSGRAQVQPDAQTADSQYRPACRLCNSEEDRAYAAGGIAFRLLNSSSSPRFPGDIAMSEAPMPTPRTRVVASLSAASMIAPLPIRFSTRVSFVT